jgi:hypothetical protein
VLKTAIHLEMPRVDLEVEGLAFGETYLTGEFGRLTIRNCAGGMSCALRGPGQAAHFANCFFRWPAGCTVGPGQSVLVDNCVTVRQSLNPRAADDDCAMLIRRCVCWSGDAQSGSVACDLNSSARPRVRAEDSVFIGGGALTISGQNIRWSGAHNVYSLVAGFAMEQQVTRLEVVQQRFDSDRDSVEVPPLLLDPEQWRLLPGQPKRPDGTDYGADVDRLARPSLPR